MAAAAVAGLLVLLAAACGGERRASDDPDPIVLRTSDAKTLTRNDGLRDLTSLPIRLDGRGVQPVAITTDGLVLLSSLRGDETDPTSRDRYALLDPRTGGRTTIATYPVRDGSVVEASRDRVRIAVDRPRPALVTYDRRRRTWSRVVVPTLPGRGTVQGRDAQVAHGRVWVTTTADRPGPDTLWSFPLGGGEPRREGAVGGYAAAGDLLAFGDPESPDVVRLRPLAGGRERAVRLPGCQVSDESPGVHGNGRWVAVRAFCSRYRDYVTLVLDARGRRVADLVLPADSFVTAVSDRFVLLSGQFAYDVRARRLLRLTDYGFEADGLPDADPRGALVGYVDSRRSDGTATRFHLARVAR